MPIEYFKKAIELLIKKGELTNSCKISPQSLDKIYNTAKQIKLQELQK